MKKIQLLLLVLCCTSNLFANQNERRWFIDKNFIYEHGSALSTEYLAKTAPDFSKKLTKILPWVVRIEVKHSFKDGGYQSNHGTGIIIKGGKVLTANHVLTQNVPPNSKVEIILTLIDGREFPATIDKQGQKDWAQLQLAVKNKDKDLLQSPITIDPVIPGEMTVFLGYPARQGLDAQGRIQSFHKGDKNKGMLADALVPMQVVATVDDPKKMKLEPVAGFPAVGGMSGGPILNLKGHLVGVQHTILTTTEDATGKILYYRIGAVPATETTNNSQPDLGCK